MNKLALLLLDHLDAAGDYMIPENTLKTTLCRLVRPVATERQWEDEVLTLLRLKFIGFEKDRLTRARKFFIREAGQVYRRQA